MSTVKNVQIKLLQYWMKFLPFQNRIKFSKMYIQPVGEEELLYYYRLHFFGRQINQFWSTNKLILVDLKSF
jgi:hypothetical protein